MKKMLAEKKELTSLFEINADLLDAFINQLLADGFLRGIPALGSIIALAKSRKTISDIILLEKMKRFMENLDHVTDEEKLKFLDELEKDPARNNKVGESVLLALDRFSDLEKAKILAIIFTSYIKEEINFNDFQRLALAIDLSCVEDLINLLHVPSRHTKEMQDGLLRSGLTSFSQHGHATENCFGDQTVYTPIVITRIGEKFREIVLKSKKISMSI